MTSSAPDVASLVRRLAETPPDFLAKPRIGRAGEVDVAAVIGDLAWTVTGRAPERAAIAALDEQASERENLQRVRLVAAWLVYDPALRRPELVPAMLAMMATRFTALAGMVDAALFVTDPDRREELVRVVLDALGLVPTGESEAQARDRLSALDSVERARVIEAARAAEERARKVREEMARKAAQEAAAKVSRE